VDLFHDAYTAEVARFADAVISRRDGVDASAKAGPGWTDARNALAIALAAAESAETGLPVEVSSVAELRAAEPELRAAGSGRHLVGDTV
jgi:myo-inositol 2-dehydrogenase/D-chiro-inositol 1-dehydrogenase